MNDPEIKQPGLLVSIHGSNPIGFFDWGETSYYQQKLRTNIFIKELKRFFFYGRKNDLTIEQCNELKKWVKEDHILKEIKSNTLLKIEIVNFQEYGNNFNLVCRPLSNFEQLLFYKWKKQNANDGNLLLEKDFVIFSEECVHNMANSL